MKDWAISIGVVVTIISLISLIIPDGKMGKYVKGMFSLLVILVIIKPFTGELDGQFTWNSQSETIQYQENYLYYTTQKRVENSEGYCEKMLENLGILHASVNISYKIENLPEISIKKVSVNLENSVINADKEHIDIIEQAKKSITEYLNVSNDVVEIVNG